MKFLADMGISPRERGHEAVHLQEQGLGKMPDGDILAKARAENVNSHLFSILEKQSAALEKGVVCSVSERKVRIRWLPI